MQRQLYSITNGTYAMILGIALKLLHLPVGNEIVVLAGFFIAIYSVAIGLKSLTQPVSENPALGRINALFALTWLCLSVGLSLKYYHWPEAWGVLSLGSIILSIGSILFFVSSVILMMRRNLIASWDRNARRLFSRGILQPLLILGILGVFKITYAGQGPKKEMLPAHISNEASVEAGQGDSLNK